MEIGKIYQITIHIPGFASFFVALCQALAQTVFIGITVDDENVLHFILIIFSLI